MAIAAMLAMAVPAYLHGQRGDFFGCIVTIMLFAVAATMRFTTVEAPTPPSPALIAWLEERARGTDNRRMVSAVDLCDYD